VYGANKAGNTNANSAPLHILRVVFLLLRKRRGAAGNGLGTTIKYLRRTTTANGLSTKINYLRRTTRGAADSGLGATNKYLRRTTSGAAGYGLGATTKYLRGAASIGLSTTINYPRWSLNSFILLYIFLSNSNSNSSLYKPI
jgi:hypothetical protein